MPTSALPKLDPKDGVRGAQEEDAGDDDLHDGEGAPEMAKTLNEPLYDPVDVTRASAASGCHELKK